MKKNIKVVPYDPNWVEVFKHEAKLIEQALGENFIRIHHVGSTSVPGLCAKPKVDIITEVRNNALLEGALEKVGYVGKGGFNIPFHQVFLNRILLILLFISFSLLTS